MRASSLVSKESACNAGDLGSITRSGRSPIVGNGNSLQYFCLENFINIGVGFPGGSEVKASAWNAGDPSSIPGLGRSPGEGNGNSLQYSCLETPMEGGAW